MKLAYWHICITSCRHSPRTDPSGPQMNQPQPPHAADTISSTSHVQYHDACSTCETPKPVCSQRNDRRHLRAFTCRQLSGRRRDPQPAGTWPPYSPALCEQPQPWRARPRPDLLPPLGADPSTMSANTQHLSKVGVRVKKCVRASTLALGIKDASSSTRSDTAHVCLPLSNGKTGPTARQPFAAPPPRQHRAQAQTKEFASGAN